MLDNIFVRDVVEGKATEEELHADIARRLNLLMGEKLAGMAKAGKQDFCDMIVKDTYVMGGAIAALATGDPVKDIDLFSWNRTLLKSVVAYLDPNIEVVSDATNGSVRFAGPNIPHSPIPMSGMYDDPIEKGECNESGYISCVTGNAITLSNKLQVIARFGPCDVTAESFDFAHTKAAMKVGDATIRVYSKQWFEALANKKLIYENGDYPVGSLARCHRFALRGYKIDPVDFLRIIARAAKIIDFDNPNIVADQLAGLSPFATQKIVALLRGPATAKDALWVVQQGYLKE